MASYYRTQGIVLQKEDRGEADRVFTVFTKDFGKLQLRAVSARKITSKLRGGLELFYYSEIGFVQGKVHKTITDSATIEYFPNMRTDILGMRIMNRLAEVTNDIVKGEELDERVWNLLLETLSALDRFNDQGPKQHVIAYYFLWNLLHITGYTPSMEGIVQQDERVGRAVQMFLDKDAEALRHFSLNGINKRILREISQQHLSKVLES